MRTTLASLALATSLLAGCGDVSKTQPDGGTGDGTVTVDADTAC
jgi:hypothetical protein